MSNKGGTQVWDSVHYKEQRQSRNAKLSDKQREEEVRGGLADLHGNQDRSKTRPWEAAVLFISLKETLEYIYMSFILQSKIKFTITKQKEGFTAQR